MNKLFRSSCAVIGFVAVTFGCDAAHAALYGGWGALGVCPADDPSLWCAGWGTIWHRDTDFSLCFAGHSVEKRSDLVLKTLEHLRHVEWAANIKFYPPGNKTIRIQSGNPLVAEDWRCPDTSDGNGQPADGDLGDIRILLRNSGDRNFWDQKDRNSSDCAKEGLLVGGAFCDICACALGFDKEQNIPIWNCSVNWGVIGNETVLSPWCNFNVKLSTFWGDDVFYLNQVLHEIGHKLGLGHEFIRSDETLDCFDDNGVPVMGSIENGVYHPVDANGKTSPSSMIFMTPFDKDSVMNYTFKNCDVVGNIGFDGFSAYDKLALKILYPEKDMLAEFTGNLVIKTGQHLFLKNFWKQSGAMIDNTAYSVAKNFSWKLDGVQISTLPDLDTSNIDISLPVGKHSLEYSYQDFLGRSYSSQSQVEVLNATAFNQLMASQAAIISAANVTASTAAISALQPAFQLLLQ